MKIKISKEEHNLLNEEVKKLYIEDEGGGFHLDVKDELSALLNAKVHEREKRKDVEKEKKIAEDRIKDLEDKINSLVGEGSEFTKEKFEELQSTMTSKHEESVGNLQKDVEKYKDFIKEVLVESKARELDAELSSGKGLLVPHILKRLSVDFDSEKPSTKILDENGSVTDLSIEGLKKEFRSNENFGDVIVASKASGGGTSTNDQGSADNSNSENSKDAVLSELEEQFN